MHEDGEDGRPERDWDADAPTAPVPAQRPPAPAPPPGPDPDEAVTERLTPVRAGRGATAGRRPGDGRRGPHPGRRADLTVAGGGLLALLGFLLAPHTSTPETGPLTLPALIVLSEAREPAVGLLRLVGTGSGVVALAGATAAGVRGRWARTALHAGALAVAALLLLGYALVGLAALRGAAPPLATGAAVVALGLLLAFLGALVALTGSG